VRDRCSAAWRLNMARIDEKRRLIWDAGHVGRFGIVQSDITAR
jgi:hypothetical protein